MVAEGFYTQQYGMGQSGMYTLPASYEGNCYRTRYRYSINHQQQDLGFWTVLQRNAGFIKEM